MRLESISCCHFPAERLDRTKIPLYVLTNFSSPLFPAERVSFSVEVKAIVEKMTVTGKETVTNALCVDRTYHSYHFPAERPAFSVEKTQLNKCVLINFSSLLYRAKRLSFSEEAKATIEEIIVKGKKAMANALCVTFKYIMVIISRLRGLPLARTRQKSVRAS